MYKFLKNSILFSIPICLLIVVCEFILRNIPNDYTLKKEFLDSNSPEIKVLNLGSSHTYYGINPDFISLEAYNAAHISQSLSFDAAIFENYIYDFKNLKYLIIPIDYFSMYSTLEEGLEQWRVKNYCIYYDICMLPSFRYKIEIINGKLEYNFMRLKEYIFDDKTDISCTNRGFGNNYNYSNSLELIEAGKSAAKRHTYSLSNISIFNKNVAILNKLLALAKQKSLVVIFITCPAYESYTKNLNKVQLQNTINAIEQIVFKNSNTHYYNFLEDKNFTKADFYDADHLNNLGAKKFTLKLDSIIQKFESIQLKNQVK